MHKLNFQHLYVFSYENFENFKKNLFFMNWQYIQKTSQSIQTAARYNNEKELLFETTKLFRYVILLQPENDLLYDEIYQLTDQIKKLCK